MSVFVPDEGLSYGFEAAARALGFRCSHLHHTFLDLLKHLINDGFRLLLQHIFDLVVVDPLPPSGISRSGHQ